MSPVLKIKNRPKIRRGSRLNGWVAGAVIVFTVALFGGTIFMARRLLFEKISEQIAGRDASLLDALCMGQLANDPTGLNSSGSPQDMLASVLAISTSRQLTNILATRLYDASGTNLLATFPLAASEHPLDPKDFQTLRKFRPICRFQARAPLNQLFWIDPSNFGPAPKTNIPLQTILVPLRAPDQSRLLGVAEFILYGKSLADEYAELETYLTRKAWLAFLILAPLIAGILGIAFYRLDHLNRLLEQRTRRLLRANQELAVAAKTSAVGAVTAHLIHGLKNPLFGLHNFIANRVGNSSASDTEWELAADSARRMQQIVNDVVRMLGEEKGSIQYEMSLAEISELLESKFRPAAAQSGVEFKIQARAEGVLVNRHANLVTLILENLLQNAIQATPQGGAVRLDFFHQSDEVVCEVSDEGGGVPETVRENLFTPCSSSKEGGSGIGLCLSKQLANHLQAQLYLKQTGPDGTVFCLRLPSDLFQPKTRFAFAAV